MSADVAGARQSLLVVSPHLDDAVLGCSDLITAYPEASVVTVFAGEPAAANVKTAWDSACGFIDAADAMAARRAEDACALRILGAQPVWLPLLDDQYRSAAARVGSALAAVVRAHAPCRIAIPLGLFHRDHQMVHAAAIDLLALFHAPAWLAYEDTFYRRIPGLLQHRLAHLERNRSLPASISARGGPGGRDRLREGARSRA